MATSCQFLKRVFKLTSISEQMWRGYFQLRSHKICKYLKVKSVTVRGSGINFSWFKQFVITQQCIFRECVPTQMLFSLFPRQILQLLGCLRVCLGQTLLTQHVFREDEQHECDSIWHHLVSGRNAKSQSFVSSCPPYRDIVDFVNRPICSSVLDHISSVYASCSDHTFTDVLNTER